MNKWPIYDMMAYCKTVRTPANQSHWNNILFHQRRWKKSGSRSRQKMGERARKFYRLVFVFALIEDLLIVNSLNGAKKGGRFFILCWDYFCNNEIEIRKGKRKTFNLILFDVEYPLDFCLEMSFLFAIHVPWIVIVCWWKQSVFRTDFNSAFCYVYQQINSVDFILETNCFAYYYYLLAAPAFRTQSNTMSMLHLRLPRSPNYVNWDRKNTTRIVLWMKFRQTNKYREQEERGRKKEMFT